MLAQKVVIIRCDSFIIFVLASGVRITVGDVTGELTGEALALALEDGEPARGPEGGAAGDVVPEHRLQRLLLPDHLHVLHPHHPGVSIGHVLDDAAGRPPPAPDHRGLEEPLLKPFRREIHDRPAPLVGVVHAVTEEHHLARRHQRRQELHLCLHLHAISTAEVTRRSSVVYDLDCSCLANNRREQLHPFVRIEEGVHQVDAVHDDHRVVTRPLRPRHRAAVSLLRAVHRPAEHPRVLLHGHHLRATLPHPQRLAGAAHPGE
ncbi:Os10g0575650, partial [Oryza sativa Japonica Group]